VLGEALREPDSTRRWSESALAAMAQEARDPIAGAALRDMDSLISRGSL
jgi:hypothetical protein